MITVVNENEEILSNDKVVPSSRKWTIIGQTKINSKKVYPFMVIKILYLLQYFFISIHGTKIQKNFLQGIARKNKLSLLCLIRKLTGFFFICPMIFKKCTK